MAESARRMADIVAQLREDPGLAGSLPHDQAAIVTSALEGASVHVIAQERGVSTEAVWTVLGNAAHAARGAGVERHVETGGLGSDTGPAAAGAPGVTGGYGDTGFGGLDTEGPEPINEEPSETGEARRHRDEAGTGP